ncbi:MAG: glycosyltransferase family 39 protein [Elusimicrobiota bacterium]|jgi:4-amino-4-deoxy-L-arabinose transferase-like glycosyltransferase
MIQRTWAVLIAGFVLLLGLLLLSSDGIHHANDTASYLQSAANVAAGFPPVGVRTSSIGYAALIAASRALGLGLWGVMAIQTLLSVLAARALFSLGQRLHSDHAGFLAALFHLWNPDIVRWHGYILTDSIYTSLVVLVTWSLVRAWENRTLTAHLAAMALVGLAAFTRINGWLLVPIALYHCASVLQVSAAKKLLLVSVCLAACAGAGLLALDSAILISETSPLERLYNGEVLGKIGRWRIPMPAAPAGAGIAEAPMYIASHPLSCLRLAGTRLAVELWHVRPEYSALHNALIASFYPLMLLFSLWTMWRFRAEALVRLCAVIAGAHLLLVSMTFPDHDGRYLLFIFPLIGLLASAAIGSIARGVRPPMPGTRSP